MQRSVVQSSACDYFPLFIVLGRLSSELISSELRLLKAPIIAADGEPPPLPPPTFVELPAVRPAHGHGFSAVARTNCASDGCNIDSQLATFWMSYGDGVSRG